MTPRIGITTFEGGPSERKVQVYAEVIRAAGGEPVWLQPSDVPNAPRLKAVLATIDGVLLSGGKDIHPRYFGESILEDASVEIDEERDAAELLLARAAVEAGLPVLGICRGIQTLNVAAGGSLYQDLAVIGIDASVHQQRGRLLEWQPAHQVGLVPGSRLASLLDGERVETNSFHHQAVHLPAPGWLVTARAPDGVIEGLEHPAHRFVVGVQWHPERMVSHDRRQRRLIEAFIAAARASRASPS